MATESMPLEIDISDVSPRFDRDTNAGLGISWTAEMQRRVWDGVKSEVYARLKPYLEDGWEVVPGTLGSDSVNLSKAPKENPLLNSLGCLVGVLTLGFAMYFFPKEKVWGESVTLMVQRRR